MIPKLLWTKSFYIGLFSVLLLACGIIRDPAYTLVIALLGGMFVAVAVVGHTFLPAMNQTAYYCKQTGRRLTAGGRPYYTYDEDIRKYGREVGFRKYLFRSFIEILVTILKVAYFCAVGYGCYAALAMIFK